LHQNNLVGVGGGGGVGEEMEGVEGVG
jgi:hypothetical protein